MNLINLEDRFQMLENQLTWAWQVESEFSRFPEEQYQEEYSEFQDNSDLWVTDDEIYSVDDYYNFLIQEKKYLQKELKTGRKNIDVLLTAFNKWEAWPADLTTAKERLGYKQEQHYVNRLNNIGKKFFSFLGSSGEIDPRLGGHQFLGRWVISIDTNEADCYAIELYSPLKLAMIKANLVPCPEIYGREAYNSLEKFLVQDLQDYSLALRKALKKIQPNLTDRQSDILNCLAKYSGEISLHRLAILIGNRDGYLARVKNQLYEIFKLLNQQLVGESLSTINGFGYFNNGHVILYQESVAVIQELYGEIDLPLIPESTSNRRRIKQRQGYQVRPARMTPVSDLQNKVAELIARKLPGYMFEDNNRSVLENPETGYPLELDCYCQELHLAIEVDGYQHYTFPNHTHKTRDEFDAAQERDFMKDNLCSEMGITLLRIREDVLDIESAIMQALKEKQRSDILKKLS